MGLWFVVLSLLVLSVTVNSTQPNILIIVVDDMGFNDIGYHNSQIYSPTIDTLANNGIRLETFYTDRECTPSRAALLTGLYNIHTGMQDTVIWRTEPRGLPLSYSLLPSKLLDAGYKTYAVGKWHLGFFQEEYCPWRRGFEKFYGLLAELGEQFSHELSGNYKVRGVDTDDQDVNIMKGRYLVEGSSETNSWEGVSTDKTQGIHTTYLYTAKAIEYLEEVPTDTPFFLYLSYQAVHFPMEVEDTFIDAGNCDAVTLEPGDVTNLENRKILCGMVAQLDLGINKIKDYLQSANRWDDTLLIFLSDNGGQKDQGGSNLPYIGEKGDYYEGGIRTPAFLSGGYLKKKMDEKTLSGYQFNDLVHITDLHALVLGLAGVPTDGIDGIDFYDQLMQTESSPARDEVLININSDLFGGSGALRVGNYKLIKHPYPSEVDFYNAILDFYLNPSDFTQESFVSFIETTHSSLFDSDSEYILIDLSQNPYEDITGKCSVAEQCSNLYYNEKYTDVRTALESKWEEYQITMVQSTVLFEDDGILANPTFFGGYWGPWRDENAVPYGMYDLTTLVPDSYRVSSYIPGDESLIVEIEEADEISELNKKIDTFKNQIKDFSVREKHYLQIISDANGNIDELQEKILEYEGLIAEHSLSVQTSIDQETKTVDNVIFDSNSSFSTSLSVRFLFIVVCGIGMLGMITFYKKTNQASKSRR